MSKKTKIFIKSALSNIFILILFVFPAVAFAQGNGLWGLVPCDNVTKPCDFNAFMGLINTVIGFLLFKLAVPIAAIMFAYAGFSLVTAQGGEAKTTAKNVFTSTVLGLAFAAGGWLIIRTLLAILGYQGDWIFSGF
jgi:amino acid transporter